MGLYAFGSDLVKQVSLANPDKEPAALGGTAGLPGGESELYVDRRAGAAVPRGSDSAARAVHNDVR
jgi:hypothetical protein